MAMIDDGHLDASDIDRRRYGNDTTPLMALVPDQPYSRGVLTSTGRTASESYLAFLRRAKKKELRNATGK